MKKKKFEKYYMLFIVSIIVLFIAFAFFISTKLIIPLGVVLVIAGLLYISNYYPTKKEIDEEKKKKEKERKEKERLKLIILTQEKKNKEKVTEDFIAIDVKTVKNEKKDEEKPIAISVVEVKDNKVEKEVKAYIKQDNVSDKALFSSNIPRQEYVKANDEKAVISNVISAIPKLKEDKKTIVVNSKEDAKIIDKVINKGKETNTTFVIPVVTSKKTVGNNNNIQESKAIRPVNAKHVASNYLAISNKEIKESKVEKPTEKEKTVCAYIKDTLKDKEEVKFSKDKDGYINVIGKTNRVKFKVDKDKNYVILPKDETLDTELSKEECNEKENNERNIRVVFNKLKDILLVKTGLINKLKKKKIIEEKVEEYNFNISYEEAKKIIKKEEETKSLIKKLDEISKDANLYHSNEEYLKELKVLSKGINKLKGKNINITNLVIRKNNLLKYLKEQKQKEKQKKLEKKPKEN